MVFYCPNCWNELPGGEGMCSNCGVALSTWEDKKYAEKLLKALSHPEPETRRRAVYLLGEKRVEEAIAPLAKLFKQSPNPFLQSEVVEAVGKIGRAREAITAAKKNQSARGRVGHGSSGGR